MHGILFGLNLRPCVLHILPLFLVLTNAPAKLKAQNTSAPDALWSRVEAHQKQQPADTAFHFILTLVRSHCSGDFDCLDHAYNTLIDSLERRFNLPGAIFAAEELVRIARKHDAPQTGAQALVDICRFQDALGNARLAAINIEKAQKLFGEAGDLNGVAFCKYWKLKSSLKYRRPEEVQPGMEALLNEAISQKDTGLIIRLHHELVELNCSARQYAKMAEHLDALEPLVESCSVTKDKKRYRMLISLSRGDLARVNNELVSAKQFYHRALLASQNISDRWIEIRCLQFLAETDWELGSRDSARSCLRRAHKLAGELHLEDLLLYSFEMDARFAEAEGRYADALESTKKMRIHEANWVNRGAGHNAANYFLEVEKENKELELSSKKAQLRNSRIIVFLIFLLAAGLLLGLYQQEKGRRRLALQNTLIQQQSEQLKSLDAAKSRFFANVSHELRTPLTLLLGPVRSLLKENHLTEKQVQLLQMADRSGKQLEQLVNEILDLRKLEMGKMGVEEKPARLRAYFLTYFAQFESLAERKQVDYSILISIDDETVANIDQEKCRQILFNLLSNAFKFTPPGGQIVVKISLENDRLQLAVADTGPGIHPDDLPHLFDRFFQTTRPDKPAEGGTGIGLNLCQEYARLFGGSIEVESTLGQGSVFRVEFPVTLAAKNSLTRVASTTRRGTPAHDEVEILPLTGASEVPHSTQPTILVVEDNHDLQDYIRSILQEKYRVVTAGHGQAALGILAASPPGKAEVGLILSDLMMPVMDGYQLLEQLKSADATRHIPVIMLTARAEAQDRLKALRIGVDDYLTKPFDEEELLARIENLLKNQKIRLEEIPSEPGSGAALPIISQPDREWLETFEAYVRQHFASDVLTVPVLAHEFAMSESTLLRQLKRLTGLSPVQYLQEVRLDEARRLLENRTYDSIAQVAAKVGYDGARSFARSFKQRFGKLPSEVLGA